MSVHELELPPEWRLRWGGLAAWGVFGLVLGAGPVAAAALTVGSGGDVGPAVLFGLLGVLILLTCAARAHQAFAGRSTAGAELGSTADGEPVLRNGRFDAA